jgi:iron complex transport system ATP-binding protein
MAAHMSPLLVYENVTVTLRRRDVVSDASFAVDRGDIVALIGPNGAGKSTLLRAGVGLIETSGGRALLHGAPPFNTHPDLRARRIAYLPQAPEAAWPITVEALVALGRFAYGVSPANLKGPDRAAINHALGLVKMESLRARMMDTISGGEQARAHLARALAQGAPLLALDEPTAELDPAHALAVLDAINAHAASGGGVLFTTHDVAFAARVAKRIHVMREGRIIAAGAPLETLTPDVLRSAYGRAGKLQTIDGAPAIAFF